MRWILDVELIDIGSNLVHESFAKDRAEVIARATAAGVTRQIVTGADVASSQAAAAIVGTAACQLWSTAGVHPHHAVEWGGTVCSELENLLSNPRIVAVGECGLDYFRNISPPAAQRTAFIAQLEIAARIGKPVFLHQRDAHEDFTAILRDHRGALTGGVAHCFTGDAAQLAEYLDLDLHIGITGWVCDERRGGTLRAAVPFIPPDRLMLETDAPYLVPRDLRPQPASRRNEPRYLPHIARMVANLRQESFDHVAASSTRNAIKFFRLEP